MTTTLPQPGVETPPPLPAAPEQAAPRVDVRLKALRRFALSITVLTVVGHAFLGFEQAPITPIVAVLTAYVTELLMETVTAWSRGRRPGYAGGWSALVTFLLPAHIVGLACAMLLYGNESVWPYAFAVAVGISLKHLIRVRVNGSLRHFLNPSNTGIVVTLLLFPWVGIAPPYQFTASVGGALDWLVPLGILMLGTMLNAKLTGKMPLIAGWVGGFIAQAFLRWLILGHSLPGALLPLTGAVFVLYTNYMITDPGTTPVKPRNQMIFGATVAAVYGVLVSVNIAFGLFFALVITCVLRGLVLVLARRRTPEVAR
ncbi:enediyne biosynthesis protein UnbU [Streptosporangium sp. NPDC023615]|uniref:enediyne biosynthesis protein UnbU n=1 Tax=Streptosporangium sp. NPDC023615 TaxID=3154794 RepID=UPI003437093A